MAGSPYDDMPGKKLSDDWEHPQPMTGRGAKPEELPPGYTSTGPPKSPSEPPSVKHALWDMIPTPSQAWNWFEPRAEYIAGRAAQGYHETMMPADWLVHSLSLNKAPDPGPRPDVGTGMVGAYAEDAMRNPLVTRVWPFRSAVAAGEGEATKGLPEAERAAITGGTGLLMGRLSWPNIRSLLTEGGAGALGGYLGNVFYGPTGAKIGAGLGLATPVAADIVRNIARNPQAAAVQTGVGLYQGSPDNDLNRSP